MNKKILYVIIVIIFIISLILLNIFLNKQIDKNEIQENLTSNLSNKENKEEKKMEILQVTSENFKKEVLESEKTVLIDFYADWCGPCKMLSPIVEKVANENEDIKVVKINVDEVQDVAVKYQIMSIPTLVVIKNGEETNRVVGLVDKSEIVNIIK